MTAKMLDQRPAFRWIYISGAVVLGFHAYLLASGFGWEGPPAVAAAAIAIGLVTGLSIYKFGWSLGKVIALAYVAIVFLGAVLIHVVLSFFPPFA